MKQIRITVEQCEHGGYIIIIWNGDLGTRITPHKCCGEREIIAHASVDEKQILESLGWKEMKTNGITKLSKKDKDRIWKRIQDKMKEATQ